MSKMFELRRKRFCRWLCLMGEAWMIIAFCGIVLTGCIAGGKRTNLVYQYSLDYKSPSFPDLSPLDAVITVSRFSAVEACNGLSMVYSPSPFERDVYNYYRWRVTPGDMTSDYLLRDFRSSGLFKAVFSSSEYESTHYLLQGEVEKFLEVDEDSGKSRADLSVNITLLDTTQTDVDRQVIFQKSYATSASVLERTPRGFAAGMSRAMSKLSEDVVRNVYRAVLKEKR